MKNFTLKLCLLCIMLFVPYGILNAQNINLRPFSNQNNISVGSSWLALKTNGSIISDSDLMSALSNVSMVSAGKDVSIALDQNGTVTSINTYNYNVTNEPDITNYLTNIVAVDAGYKYGLALNENGSVSSWGHNEFNQCSLNAASNVIAVSAGKVHSLTLLDDGTVESYGCENFSNFSWSSINPYSEDICEVPLGLSEIIAIDAGERHSLAVDSDGFVHAWGQNNHYQCNIPEGLEGVVQVSAGEYFSAALKSDGTVVLWGSSANINSELTYNISNVVAISAKDNALMLLYENGTVSGDFTSSDITLLNQVELAVYACEDLPVLGYTSGVVITSLETYYAGDGVVLSFPYLNVFPFMTDLSSNQSFQLPQLDQIKIFRDDVLIETISDLSNPSVTFENGKIFLTDYSSIENCETYSYKVKVTSCNKQIDSNTSEILIQNYILEIFDESKKLDVSKGYYSNLIKLNWDNNSTELIEKFVINRRVLGSLLESDWLELDYLNNDENVFIDNLAEANQMYQYRIDAQIVCGTETTLYSSNIEVGFRLSESTASGHIEFAGGNAVKDSKVAVQPTSPQMNNSIHLSNNQLINFSSLFINNPEEFTFSFWLKSDSVDNNEKTIISSNTFNINLDQDDNLVLFNGTEVKIIPLEDEIIYNWNNITLVYENELKLYFNGVLMEECVIPVDISEVYIGGESGNNFQGYFDEFRVFNIPMNTSQVLSSFDKQIGRDYTNLLGLYHCDEGIGNYIYDVSKKTNGGFNQNHIQLNNVSFSFKSPSQNQLSNYSLTDANGNYIVEGIRYNGTGNNFTITPTTTVPFYQTPHEFEPSQRVVYLGDQVLSSAGQNFTDVSSFVTTGHIFYHDLHDLDGDANTSEKSAFPVEGVMIKIDGEVVIKNGELITTNTDGYFEIEVPIGDHRISVEKQGHTFVSSDFPGSSTVFNFQEAKSGLQFIDNTVIQVKGRSVGGAIEQEKKIGLSLSINNIGVTTFKFSSQKLSGLDNLLIETDSNSGEYSTELLPEKYVISEFNVPSNPSIVEYSQFQSFDVFDLTAIPELTTVTLQNTVSSPQTATYHFDKSFNYMSPPSIRVMNMEKTELFSAEQTLTIGESTISNLESLGHPIFKQDAKYDCHILIEEVYENYDLDIVNPIINRVPVRYGNVTIANNLSTDPTEIVKYLDDPDGIIFYTFKAGFPNLLTNVNEASNSFTKTWNINFQSDPFNVSWNPNGAIYRGIVFGMKPDGSNFVTEGPQVVSHILRDPPGSGSFAFYEEGSTVSHKMNISTSLGGSYGLSSEVKLGPTFTVGLGYETEADLTASSTNTTTITASLGHDGEYIKSTTFNSRFSTNATPYDQGSLMDVYVGNSMNMNFGMSTILTLIDIATCDMNYGAIECIGEEVNGYKIGTQKGFFAVPGGYETEFYYTQYDIIGGLIPELEMLRENQLITNSRYTNVTSNPVAPLYRGMNNDDLAFDDLAIANELNTQLNSGPSYTFTTSVEGVAQIDSVRWYNQQIRLWKEAIARNEKLKINATAATTGPSNISADGGVGELTFTYQNDTTSSNSLTWEASINQEWATEVGAELGGIGVTLGANIQLHLNHSGSHTFSDQQTTTVGFTFYDGDISDKYSFDVKDDGTKTNGKVFSVQGGRTACPYQEAELTLFYEPETVLSAATIQMEQPAISLSPSSLANVPEDEEAIFNLTLGNNNPLGYPQVYTLKVLEMSNPDGAIIKVDGLSPNRDFMVPAGTSINKTMTVTKGPEALDYQEITLQFHSPCQFDPIDLENSIYEEVTFSVSFLPGCTDINILSPDPNWVFNSNDVNVSDDDQNGKSFLDVMISDYNYNYYSLNNIKLQYKESISSDWVNISSFYKENQVDQSPIPTNQSFINSPWELTDLSDGDYDIRAITDCNLATDQTAIYSGHIDRLRPYSFGNPSPADGILDPNDEIQLNFNENINEGLLGSANFNISGILNGSEIRHDASLYFDGEDLMTIPTGINLQNKSFTIEMWINAHSEGVLFTQGYSGGDQMSLSLNEAQKLEFNLSGQTAISTSTVDLNIWKHITVLYNQETGQADFLINGDLQNINDGGINILADYQGEGPIRVGMGLTGNIHELRVWKGMKNSGDIFAEMLKTQSGREANLFGLWPMDELEGAPQDKARSRHASTSATWQVTPGGMAYSFEASSSEFLSGVMSDLSFRDDQDFTIEVWFKADGSNQTIISNGTVISTPANPEILFGNYNGWTIKTNEDGRVEVISNLITVESIGAFTDNNWHHLALVKNSLSTTNLYIDGTEQVSLNSNLFKGFGGAELVIGATSETNSDATVYTDYLNGSVDELRIWSKARKLDQITRDARAKLEGDESGLVAYYPFEYYTLDNFNQYVTTSTTSDQHSDTFIYAAHNLSGSGSYNGLDKPLVRLSRSIEDVNFNYSSNGDQIILSYTDDLKRLEGCILDVEVDGIEDLYGNSMSSPVTWSAYINQNQLIWDDQEINKDKLQGESMSFTTTIINHGGTVESFILSNLPDWLTASPSEGNLAPNSYEIITFSVNENLFIGDYSQDIILTGNNVYGERLELNINVASEVPNYSFTSSDFEYSMSIIGQIQVGEFISRDENDILFVYINDELRGAANPFYIEQSDRYDLFLDVYSNQESNESLEFRVWDASEGRLYSSVNPNDMSFLSNHLIGSPAEPQLFVATNLLRQEIELQQGWNWISYNLEAQDDSELGQMSIPTATLEIESNMVEVFRSQDSFMQYLESYGWIGSMNTIDLKEMYKVKIDQKDTIVYQGHILDLTDPIYHIEVSEGWNWISYLGLKHISIAEALSSLNPSTNDLIKGKSGFSVYYNDQMGWLGSLSNLSPGNGYMLKSLTEQILEYPESSLYGSGSFRLDDNQYANDYWNINPNKHEHSMSIIAKIDAGMDRVLAIENVLGAFNGNVCVGNISVTPIESESYLYFLTVYGNQEEELSFSYYDVAKDKVYKAQNRLIFEPDALVGSIENPYPILIDIEMQDAEDYFSLSVYPNPFDDVFELEFYLEKTAQVEIHLYDVAGRWIETIVQASEMNGMQKVLMNCSDISKGLYFIELNIDGKAYQKKIIKN